MNARHVFTALLALIIIGLFGHALHLTLTHAIPAENKDAANIILGILGTLSVNFAQHYIGSAISGAFKDNVIAGMARDLGRSTPPEDAK